MPIMRHGDFASNLKRRSDLPNALAYQPIHQRVREQRGRFGSSFLQHYYYDTNPHQEIDKIDWHVRFIKLSILGLKDVWV